MSTGTFETVGPDAGVSREDRETADALVDVLDELPVLSREEVRDRHVRGKSVHSENTPIPPRFERKYRPTRHRIPGFGERREDCGVEIPHICKGCGHRIEVGRTCAQSMCPRCAPAWVTDRAPGIVNRIYSAAKMKPGSQKLHHVVMSPPPGLLLDADDWYGEAMDAIKGWMEEIGMDGIILPHPWSGDDDVEDDRGEWKSRLFNDRDWSGDVRDELQHRPHFHVIGCAEWVPGGDVTELVHEQTGWVTHRIAKNNQQGYSLDGIHDLARGVTYALSHVAVDTEGDRNRYLRKKVGSAYHRADDRHERAAEKAVNAVAPDTLGIPSMKVECQKELPEAETEDDHDHTPTDSGDGDGSGVEDGPEADTTTPTAPCRRKPVDVDDADFVEDEDWQQGAKYADEAVETRREWKEAGGWQAWVERAREDDPPPD